MFDIELVKKTIFEQDILACKKIPCRKGMARVAKYKALLNFKVKFYQTRRCRATIAVKWAANWLNVQ